MMEIRSMETAAVEIVRLKIYTFAMAEDPHIETLVIIITLEAQFWGVPRPLMEEELFINKLEPTIYLLVWHKMNVNIAMRSL